MTSLLQKINALDTKDDGLDSSNLQTQITTNTNDISSLQTNKQNTLIAGDNITITGDTISSSGGGSTIDSTTDINCNTLTTLGDVNVGGQITSPNQISLRARRQGNIIINTRVHLPYNVAMFNIGGAYNTTTYEFTAPISGTYFFYVSFFTDNNNNYMVDIRQKTPIIDIEQERMEQLNYGSGGLTKKFGSVTFFLNLGDVVYTEWRAGRVRLSDGGIGAALTNFGGYYLG